tara:strand:+ start:6920 stop:7246 length:327 start_codon:yes stop_codon:yes gene_type:complete
MADTNSWNYYGNTGGLAVKSKYSSNSGNNNIQDQLRDDAVATAQADTWTEHQQALNAGQTSPVYNDLEIVFKDSYRAVYTSAGESADELEMHGDWSAWWTATFPPASP